MSQLSKQEPSVESETLKSNLLNFDSPAKFGYLDVTFNLSESLLHQPSNRPSTPHNHHDYEVYYISSGHCTLNIEGKTYTASAGDLLLVHPLEYHCRTHISPSNAAYFNFRFSVKQPPEKENHPLPLDAYECLEKLLLQTRTIHCREKLLLLYLNRLHNELKEEKAGYWGNAQALFMLIFTEFIRFAGELPEWFFPNEESKFRGYDRNAIDAFFASKYLSNVKIQDLAYDMKVSVRQVNRIMHRMFGMSFTQKLTEMRLWEVARQLSSTQKTVTTISQNCGFNNYNYFYICFRKKFNMTPTEFRTRNIKP